MEIKIKLELPSLPNFLRTKLGDYMAVEELSDEEIKELGAEWTAALIAMAHKKRRLKDKLIENGYGN